MSTDLGVELLVAIQHESLRIITPVLQIDERGVLVRPQEVLPVGQRVRIQIRAPRGAVRTFNTEIFRARGGGYRLEFDAPNRVQLSGLLRLVRREDETPVPERGQSTIRPAPVVHVSGPRLRETFVIKAHDADARRAVGAEVRRGLVFIETREPPEAGVAVLLRIELGPDQAVYLGGRVEYRSESPAGCGVALEQSPALGAVEG